MESGINRLSIILALYLVFTLAFTPFSSSYAQTGNISGKVTNSSGAAFPGVSLSVFDQNYCDKAFAFNIDTKADGTYAIPNVPTGTYKVRFFPIPIRRMPSL